MTAFLPYDFRDILMEIPSGTPSNFLNSLRAFADKLLASLQSRLTLLSVELQEEKLRLIQLLIWITAALFTGVMSLAFCSLALAFWLWKSSPLVALTALSGVYVIAFVVIVISFKRYLKRQPRPFDATIQELTDDRECIQRKN